MDEGLLRAATEYLNAGHHLLALVGKKPIGRLHPTWDWDNSIHGTIETAEDREQLQGLLQGATGVAILVPPHVLIADVDSERAASIFAELVDEIPETIIAQTSKGYHIWFLAPGADHNIWLGGKDGLLLKGFNGYVVAPPSKHPDGSTYEWISPPEAGIAWLPDGLRDAITAHDAVEQDFAFRDDKHVITAAVHEDGKWRVDERPMTLNEIAERLATATEGSRNTRLFMATATAQEVGATRDETLAALTPVALKLGLTAAETRTTITSHFRRVAREAAAVTHDRG